MSFATVSAPRADPNHAMYTGDAKRKKRKPGKVPTSDPFPISGTLDERCAWMRRKHGAKRLLEAGR